MLNQTPAPAVTTNITMTIVSGSLSATYEIGAFTVAATPDYKISQAPAGWSVFKAGQELPLTTFTMGDHLDLNRALSFAAFEAGAMVDVVREEVVYAPAPLSTPIVRNETKLAKSKASARNPLLTAHGVTRKIRQEVDVDTQEYELSHGRKPSGHGSWAFRMDAPESTPMWIPGSMTYGAAKKIAIAQIKAKYPKASYLVLIVCS